MTQPPSDSTQVYQGEDDWSVNNILVGEFVIDGIQRAKAGVAKFIVKVCSCPRLVACVSCIVRCSQLCALRC